METMSAAESLLKSIRKKGSVHKEDLKKILLLSKKNQEYIINHISQRR